MFPPPKCFKPFFRSILHPQTLFFCLLFPLFMVPSSSVFGAQFHGFGAKFLVFGQNCFGEGGLGTSEHPRPGAKIPRFWCKNQGVLVDVQKKAGSISLTAFLKILVDFLSSSLPGNFALKNGGDSWNTKRSTKTPQKKFGENSEQYSGQNSGRKFEKFGELLFCNFSDLRCHNPGPFLGTE